MNLRIIAVIVVAVVLAAVIALFSFGFPIAEKPHTGELRVSYLNFESAAPFLIAQDRGFFTQDGLDVTAKPYTNGAFAVDDVLEGRADIAVGAAEYPVVADALRNDDIRVIGTFDKADIIFLVVRNETGNVSDLRGKRIGYTPGTMTAFSLDRFLSLHGLSEREIVPVAVSAADITDLATTGRIDAVVTLQPFVDQMRNAWGGNVTVLHVQGGQPVFALVIANGTWAGEHPETVRIFLASLDKGIQYLDAYPEESFLSVRGRIGLNPTYLEAFRQQNQFGLSLDQSLVTAMEDEARWMIQNNLTNATEVPDFRNYISTDGLKSVKPGSVNIIG